MERGRLFVTVVAPNAMEISSHIMNMYSSRRCFGTRSEKLPMEADKVVRSDIWAVARWVDIYRELAVALLLTCCDRYIDLSRSPDRTTYRWLRSTLDNNPDSGTIRTKYPG